MLPYEWFLCKTANMKRSPESCIVLNDGIKNGNRKCIFRVCAMLFIAAYFETTFYKLKEAYFDSNGKARKYAVCSIHKTTVLCSDPAKSDGIGC